MSQQPASCGAHPGQPGMPSLQVGVESQNGGPWRWARKLTNQSRGQGLREVVRERGSLSEMVPLGSVSAARHGNFGTPWAERGRGISLSVILLNVMPRNCEVRGKLLPSSVQLLPAPPGGKVGVWRAV